MFLPSRPTGDALRIIDELQEQQRQTYIKNCVHALLVLGQKRNTIKRLELNRLAFPNVNYKVSAAIVQAANKELIKTFGMRIYELDDKSKYLLVNITPNFNDLVIHSDAMCEELTVLYFILMDIFISSDQKLSEEDIENSMDSLDLKSDTLKSYLDSFVKHLYLNHELQQAQQEGERIRMYSWGPRAVAETDPDNFFKRFLEMVPTTTEKDWPDLKKRIEKLKKDREEA